jgi:alkylhydroperoxidase family enzyme
MAWIETIAEDAADGELAELYAAARDPEFGRVDAILTIHALHPAGLRAHLELYRAVMRGSAGLPKLDRELIALVVSRLNGCGY